MTVSWRDLFPLDQPPREGQITAIESILEGFAKGENTHICDLPTGSGKSAIAVTVARYLDATDLVPSEEHEFGSYVLTTQKVLQEQYLREFAPEDRGGMLELKSSTNYQCGFDRRQSCGESKRALTALGKVADGSRWKRHCTSDCSYNDAKRAFLQGRLGISNYSYFLAESTYAGKLKPRKLLVCDECHTVDNQLTSFVEVELSEAFSRKRLNLPLVSSDDPEKILEWLREKYRPALLKNIKSVQGSLAAYTEPDNDDPQFRDLVKQNDMLDKHVCKVNRFVDRYDPAGWVVNRVRSNGPRGERQILQFKPIDAVAWAEPCLLRFGRRRLLMSATVLDRSAFCRSLGLDESKTGYVDLPSTFPLENRPIHYLPVGKMSVGEIDATLPKLANAVRELLAAHPDEKGIIHATSFKVARYLHETLEDPRILIHDDRDRDKVLAKHRTSTEPTVLCSPSMMEGVSLDDDLARFQIVAKIPYPHLGDKALRKRIERDPGYYQYLTARSFVQMIGRAVRHEADHCVTYILDSCFSNFLRTNEDVIPRYVLDAIVR